MASSIVVNTDTYISAADAATYIAAYHLTTETNVVAYSALSEANKDAVLRKAAQIIDRQPLVGLKSVSSQTMEFPRAIWTDAGMRELPVASTILNEDWNIQTTVPTNVKYAQVEIALWLAAGTPKRVELQRQGVKSFSVGGLSENYGSGSKNYLPQEARELLQPYLAGSVPVC